VPEAVVDVRRQVGDGHTRAPLVEAVREPRIPDHAIALERSRRWQRLPLF